MPPSDSTRATRPAPRPASYRDSTLAIFTLLLAFRIVNALTLRTFFQPDEFFQSLEPAWQLAFGAASNAWITWEWRSQLRSSLHPDIFAAVYQVAAKLSSLCALSLPAEAELFIAAPKVTQAVCAALLDFYTWKLAEKLYGRRTLAAFASLALSVCSPWQWFCSTRTLSNCLETTITSIAVCYWPWHWPRVRDRNTRDKSQDQHSKKGAGDQDILGPFFQLRLSLVLAAFACILRPTNILIWVGILLPTLWQASSRQRYILVREIFSCGSAVLACSVLSDRAYYQVWTLPPLRFLHFNIAQSLAVFYGRNRPDYYLTEGLPLLLTTALPFAAVGLWQALCGKSARASVISSSTVEEILPRSISTRLAWTTVFMTLTLSLISHKEVRFLYPVLPFLHVLSAGPLTSFFSPWTLSRKAILASLLAVNLLIAGYTSQVHQRGVMDVLDHLRHKHEARAIVRGGSGSGHGIGSDTGVITTVGFLMPCHSTPWRSHLVYPSLHAWALTCEPPLNVPLSQRSTYLDEADEFYINPGPLPWLVLNMEDPRPTSSNGVGTQSGYWPEVLAEGKQVSKRSWPQNVVFFEQLEETISMVLSGTEYRECWRGFNTHFHDDGRRRGDVIVWCKD